MLKKVEANCKQCKKSFLRREPSRNFAQLSAGMQRGKSLEKDASRVTPRGSVANGSFSPTNSGACKAPYTPDFGVLVRAHIEAQQDKPNPRHQGPGLACQ
jgi:hypothetical protein